MNVVGTAIRARAGRAIALAGALVSAGVVPALHPGKALAESRPLLPARCFAPVGVDHVVFDPNSFFEPSTVQGPTSFKENSNSTVVTYPLYHGTSNGRDAAARARPCGGAQPEGRGAAIKAPCPGPHIVRGLAVQILSIGESDDGALGEGPFWFAPAL